MLTIAEKARGLGVALRAHPRRGAMVRVAAKRVSLQAVRFATNNVVAQVPSGRLRLSWYRSVCVASIGRGSHVGRGLYLYLAGRSREGARLELGEGVEVGERCCLDSRGGLRIGDGTIIAPGCWLLTDSHDINDPRFPEVLSPIRIGRSVWLGHRATVLPGVTIGDGAVVLPGAVVTKDVPPGAVVHGVPARPVRDTEQHPRA